MDRGRATTSRVLLTLTIIAAAAFVLGPLGAAVGLLAPLTAFSAFGLGGLLGVAVLLVSAVAALRKGFRPAAAGLIIGGLITICFVGLALPARNLPRINDISTDTAQPPQFVSAAALPENAGRDMAYPGDSFAQQQNAAYPSVKPLLLDEPPAAAFERVARTAGTMPQWEITRTDASAMVLEGVATSRLFRFKDDFVVEVRPSANGAVVHMRSKSRDGRGDVGANAARIEAFFTMLRAGSASN